MRYTFPFIILAISGIHIAASAHDGGGHHPDPAKVFAQADANQDGVLSLGEFTAHVQERANNPNRPKDAPPPPSDDKIAERFKAMDTDNSGTLTLAEFQAGHHGPRDQK